MEYLLLFLIALGIPFVLPIATWVYGRRTRARLETLESVVEEQSATIRRLDALVGHLRRAGGADLAPPPADIPPPSATAPAPIIRPPAPSAERQAPTPPAPPIIRPPAPSAERRLRRLPPSSDRPRPLRLRSTGKASSA